MAACTGVNEDKYCSVPLFSSVTALFHVFIREPWLSFTKLIILWTLTHTSLFVCVTFFFCWLSMEIVAL